MSSAPASWIPQSPVSFENARLIRQRAAHFPYEDVQDAIDIVYDLRARVIRIGFFGTMLHRPDPFQPTLPAQQQEFLTILKEQVHILGQVTALLRDATPFPGIDPEIGRWMQVNCLEYPESMALLFQITQLSRQILSGVAPGGAAQSQLLSEHMRVARAGFHDAIADICEGLWSRFEVYRLEELAASRNAAKALHKRLNRLERIGTHVRLVSLNASVEASRFGEAGHGIAVIAREFKQLAEEVGALARDARNDVASMHTRK